MPMIRNGSSPKKEAVMSKRIQVVSLAVLFAAGMLAPLALSQETGSPKKPLVSATTLSLKEMTDRADRIFIATVQKVESVKLPYKDEEGDGELNAQRITFVVKEVLKGELEVGKALTINQYAHLKSNVSEKEELLWFLPKESKFKLVAPLGYYSGHFLVHDDETSKGHKSAVNLKGNVGLWPAKYQIVGEKSDARRERFLSFLKKEFSFLKKEFPDKQSPARLSFEDEKRIDEILKIAETPYQARELPIELIKACTRIYAREREDALVTLEGVVYCKRLKDLDEFRWVLEVTDIKKQTKRYTFDAAASKKYGDFLFKSGKLPTVIVTGIVSGDSENAVITVSSLDLGQK